VDDVGGSDHPEIKGNNLLNRVCYWINIQFRIASAWYVVEDEFELTILDSGDPTRAIVMARAGFDQAVESFSDLDLKSFVAFRTLLSDAAGGRALVRPTALQLEQFGRGLFDLVVRNDIQRIYNRLPQSHIRLKIYSNRSDVQGLPWEYIQEPNCVPGPNAFRSVVRVVPTIGVPAPVAKNMGQILRMLFVYAEPPRSSSTDWPTIKASIETKFKARLPQKNFELDVVEGATKDSFTAAFRSKKYDILHMVCHGAIEADGSGSLLFQDIKGKSSESIPASALGAFLKDKELRVVVLSACNTAAGNFAREFAVVAKTLVQNSVPAVVANQFEIENSAAAAFAGGFYAELLVSGDLDRATTKGRMELVFGGALPNNAAKIDWGIPTLYRHLGASQAFKP
jgi:CHAT domain